MNLRDDFVDPIINAIGLQKLTPLAIVGLGRLLLILICLGFAIGGNFMPSILVFLLVLLGRLESK